MALLTKEQIISADDLKHEDVDMTPYGWGGSVRVRTLTGTEKDRFEEMTVKAKEDGTVAIQYENYRAKLLSFCIVDEKGNRLFTEKEVAAIGGKSAAALEALVSVAHRLNGIGKKDVEAITKNS